MNYRMSKRMANLLAELIQKDLGRQVEHKDLVIYINQNFGLRDRIQSIQVF